MDYIEIGERPWGIYKVIIIENDYKIKNVTVNPGKRLSLQFHNQRSEHWFILKGKAKVTINKKEFLLKSGDSIDIIKKSVHRIENISNEDLVFIEIQTGSYLSEDDIVRLEDDFNRVESGDLKK